MAITSSCAAGREMLNSKNNLDTIMQGCQKIGFTDRLMPRTEYSHLLIGLFLCDIAYLPLDTEQMPMR